jgi:hypothetical protein
VYVSLLIVVMSLYNSSPSASLVQQFESREHIPTFSGTLNLARRINHIRNRYSKCHIVSQIRGGEDDELSKELQGIEWQHGEQDEKDDALTEGDFSDCSYEYQEIKPNLRLDPSAPPPVLGAQVASFFYVLMSCI